MFRVCMVALALGLAACQTIPQPGWDLPVGVRTLPANGYPMAYVERGSGPTVVLVHGALWDYRYWEPQTTSLSPRFHIIAVSLRHYYPERWNGKGDDFSLRHHAEDLAVFIEGLGVGPVHVVGHSRGGRVAFEMARLRPDLVRKLVLMEAVWDSLLPAPNGAATLDPRPARRKGAAARFERGDLEGGLEFYVDDVNGRGAWKRRTAQERQIAQDNAWTLIGEMGEPPQVVTCAEVGSLRMPVLLMGGEKSPRRFANILDVAQKCLPSAGRVTIPDAAHQMNRMNPTAFDAALVNFLLD